MSQRYFCRCIDATGNGRKGRNNGSPQGCTFVLEVVCLVGAGRGVCRLGSHVRYESLPQDHQTLPYGVARMLIGLTFCIGLILIVVGGAELFTGNILIVMAWASRKVSTRALLRNWVIVYLGNFVGSLGTATLVFFSKQYTFGDGSVGAAALKIAASKMHYGLLQAVVLGILCNGLVCLAIWLTYSARSTGDKILAIVFPITAFVAASFEHSIANMYFLPYALFIKNFDSAFVTSLADKAPDLSGLTWGAFFLKNLLPVTFGNIIGGAGLVALIYWFVYLRGKN